MSGGPANTSAWAIMDDSREYLRREGKASVDII